VNKVLFIFGFVTFFVLIVFIPEGIPQAIDPLIDTPGKSIGSDFNGDGIHDVIISARNNIEGTGNGGTAYVFFGASNFGGIKDLGGVASPDVSIFGKGATDQLGNKVASAGDVNGDGIDDILVGAFRNNDGGFNDTGAAYIFFGATNISGTKDLGGKDSADVTVIGEVASDLLGVSLSGAGDVNGDGFDDFIVGARYSDEGGAANTGVAFIFFGTSDISGTFDPGKGLKTADVTILGSLSLDRLGSVSGAGDVNGDGFDDVIVGAFDNDDGIPGGGAAYVIFGASNLSGNFDMGGGVQSADVTIFGKANSDRFGLTVSGGGDVNGDGFDDFLVGADRNDDGGTYNGGAAYVFFGASNLSGTKSLGGADSADVTVLGKGVSDRFSYGLSNAGDINDDGFDDIMMGAHNNNDGGSNDEGAAYVIYGGSNLSGTRFLAGADSADVTILGKGIDDFLGFSVSGIGDVNADGFPDIIVGAYRNNDGAGNNDAGAAYILFGSSTLSGTFDMGGGVLSPDVTFLGKIADNYLGYSVGGGRSNPGP